MADWKYVMFEDDKGRKYPVIFPGTLVHADMAEAVATQRLRSAGVPWVTPIAAGHIDSLLVLDANGRSDSLNMDAGPKDTNTINTMPYTNGVEGGTPGIETLMSIRFMEMLSDRIRKQNGMPPFEDVPNGS